jgi:hypothetical protein
MDVFVELAAVVLAGLSFVLAAIGASAARRYRDARLALVAGGLAVIGGVGILGLLHQISPLYGGPFDITVVPLVLLVVAVGLVYVALVRRGPRSPKS